MKQDISKVDIDILRRRNDLETGLPMSRDDIKVFFYRDTDLLELFMSLFEYIREKDEKIVCRYNGGVIGLSEGNKKYLVYVSLDGEKSIKFRTQSSKWPLQKDLMEEYLQECDKLLDLDYHSEPEISVLSVKRNVKRKFSN